MYYILTHSISMIFHVFGYQHRWIWGDPWQPYSTFSDVWHSQVDSHRKHGPGIWPLVVWRVPRPSRDHMVGLDYSYSIDSIAWFPAGTIDLTHTSRVSFRFDMRKSLHSFCKFWNHAKEKRRKEWHQRIHQRSELFFL